MKIGDYVRTKNGSIFKIIGGTVDDYDLDIDYFKLEQTEENWLELYRYNDNHNFFNDKNIIKSSPNLIDLIEVGDYVNGYLVLNVLDFNDNTRNLSLEKYYDNNIVEKHIKSIVTKELFESMEYRIKGETNE